MVDIIAFYSGLFAFALFFFLLMPMLFFIKNKKLPMVEDILEDSNRFFSLNILMAGWGVLHYATIFFWDRHAKRYELYDRRELVPVCVRRWFIIYYCLFMFMCFLFFIAALIVHFALEKI